MFRLSNKTVLVLSPHPDDEVFGCGGFIHRLKQAGSKVFVLFMTNGTTTHFGDNATSSKQERRREVEKVAEFFGYDGYDIAFEGDRYHLQLDQVAQHLLVERIERGGPVSLEALQPDIVLTPLANDYNQDHRATFTAATTALRPAAPDYRYLCPTVLGYELPYQQWNVAETVRVPDLLVKLDAADIAAKLSALELYGSQLKSATSPLSVHGARTLATFRGLQCGALHAEAYSTLRMVV